MEWIRGIGKLILVLLLQVLLFDHLHIGIWGFPMMYVIFLLNLPSNLAKWAELLIGFLVGLIIDICHTTLGIHIAACVAISFLRPILLQHLVQDIERINDNITGNIIGIAGYVRLSIILIVIHHLIVISLETWNLELCWMVILQTLVCTLLTSIVILGFDRLRR